MKKFIAILVSLILVLPVVSACGTKNEDISLYFKSSHSNSLEVENRNAKIKDASVEEIAKYAVTELIKGPLNEKNAPVISKDAKLLKLEVKDGVATVNMSKHYSDNKSTDELLLRASLVNTLCSIDGIDAIVILVDGNPIVSAVTGKEIGVIRQNDIVLDGKATQLKEKTTIKLYFPSEDGTSLGSETRTVEIQNALSLEKTVINELIKGPQSKNLVSSVPQGTKILAGTEIKDSVCFVNFSGDFVSNSNSGSLSTTLTLYSVVNSLCELENVESVQILINGETGVEFGNFVLDIPYEPNLDLIK